jgi:hypothetical protein
MFTSDMLGKLRVFLTYDLESGLATLRIIALSHCVHIMRTGNPRHAYMDEMLIKQGTLLTLSRVQTDNFHCTTRRKELKFVEIIWVELQM